MPVQVDRVVLWARALGHPTRVAVLGELLVTGVASPLVLAERLGQPLGQVAYHVRTLRAWRVLELSETIPRRGAVEHRYRLAPGAHEVLLALLALVRQP